MQRIRLVCAHVPVTISRASARRCISLVASFAEAEAAGALFVDIGSREAFVRAHIPAAAWLTSAGSNLKGVGEAAGRVLPPEHFEALANSIDGAAPSRALVFYGDADAAVATARIAWVFRYYGVGNAAVLDGGWPKYASSRQAGTIIASGPPPGSARSVEPFVAQPQRHLLTTTEDIAVDVAAAAAGSGRRLQLLDLRTEAEFAGLDLRGNRRGGHIPGAVNVPHAKLFAAGGGLLSSSTLRDVFMAAGLQPTLPVVAICQAGIRAALGFVAVSTAGFEHVSNYDASMAEWLQSTDPRAKVE